MQRRKKMGIIELIIVLIVCIVGAIVISWAINEISLPFKLDRLNTKLDFEYQLEKQDKTKEEIKKIYPPGHFFYDKIALMSDKEYYGE